MGDNIIAKSPLMVPVEEQTIKTPDGHIDNFFIESDENYAILTQGETLEELETNIKENLKTNYDMFVLSETLSNKEKQIKETYLSKFEKEII